jgi:hypothetical protein
MSILGISIHCVLVLASLGLILRSVAKQRVSKDGAALVLRDAAFGRSSG